jgi:hypothetical protein
MLGGETAFSFCFLAGDAEIVKAEVCEGEGEDDDDDGDVLIEVDAELGCDECNFEDDEDGEDYFDWGLLDLKPA